MSARQSGRAEHLARRRALLVQRSAGLRQQLHGQLRLVQPAFAWADRLQDTWHWLRANPLVVAAGVLAFAAWRPRRSLSLALRFWSAWKLLQRARSVGSAASRLL